MPGRSLVAVVRDLLRRSSDQVGEDDLLHSCLVEVLQDGRARAGVGPVHRVAGGRVGVRLGGRVRRGAGRRGVADGDAFAGLGLDGDDPWPVERDLAGGGAGHVVVGPVVDLRSREGDGVEGDRCAAAGGGVVAGVLDRLEPQHGLQGGGVLGVDRSAGDRVVRTGGGVGLAQLVGVDGLGGASDLDLGGNGVQSGLGPEGGRGVVADPRLRPGQGHRGAGGVRRVAVQVVGYIGPVGRGGRVEVRVGALRGREGWGGVAARRGCEVDLSGGDPAGELVRELVAVGDLVEVPVAGVRGEGAGAAGAGGLAAAHVVVAGLGGVVVPLQVAVQVLDEVQVELVPHDGMGRGPGGAAVAGVGGVGAVDRDAPGGVGGRVPVVADRPGCGRGVVHAEVRNPAVGRGDLEVGAVAEPVGRARELLDQRAVIVLQLERLELVRDPGLDTDRDEYSTVPVEGHGAVEAAPALVARVGKGADTVGGTRTERLLDEAGRVRPAVTDPRGLRVARGGLAVHGLRVVGQGDRGRAAAQARGHVDRVAVGERPGPRLGPRPRRVERGRGVRALGARGPRDHAQRRHRRDSRQRPRRPVHPGSRPRSAGGRSASQGDGGRELLGGQVVGRGQRVRDVAGRDLRGGQDARGVGDQVQPRGPVAAVRLGDGGVVDAHRHLRGAGGAVGPRYSEQHPVTAGLLGLRVEEDLHPDQSGDSRRLRLNR